MLCFSAAIGNMFPDAASDRSEGGMRDNEKIYFILYNKIKSLSIKYFKIEKYTCIARGNTLVLIKLMNRNR